MSRSSIREPSAAITICAETLRFLITTRTPYREPADLNNPTSSNVVDQRTRSFREPHPCRDPRGGYPPLQTYRPLCYRRKSAGAGGTRADTARATEALEQPGVGARNPHQGHRNGMTRWASIRQGFRTGPATTRGASIRLTPCSTPAAPPRNTSSSPAASFPPRQGSRCRIHRLPARRTRLQGDPAFDPTSTSIQAR